MLTPIKFGLIAKLQPDPGQRFWINYYTEQEDSLFTDNFVL